MSIYNALFEASTKLRKASLEGSKATKEALSTMAKSAKESETVKSATPALGKLAKYAAYPAGVGAGLGLGAAAVGVGASSAITNTGDALQNSWAPTTAADAGSKVLGVGLLLLFVGGVAFLYLKVKE